MQPKKFSELDLITNLDGTETIPLLKGGQNKAAESKDLPVSIATQSALNAIEQDITDHIADHDNPHETTKAQVGLGSADNTSDANKPISTATQAALDTKATTAALTAHTSNTNNPHSVTKAQVGLGNADDTSDADKPVSTATQSALNAKANASDTVNLTGDQTIAGVKTFSSSPVVPTATTGTQAVNKAQMDTADALKVDKATPGVQSLYTVSSTGTQGTVRYSESVINQSVPIRDAAGGLLASSFVLGTASGPAIRQGTGFPEGVVSAPVGSTYIDANATNGAVVWTKMSGTGNTGWVVSVGDTGWRDVSSLLINGWVKGAGTTRVKRVNNTVTWYAALNGMDGSAATSDMFATMPFGFVVDSSGNHDVLGSSYTNFGGGGPALVSRSFNELRTSGRGERGWLFDYNTTQSWPTVLP